MPAACDRVFCLTLGWERIPRALAVEAGGEGILRLPLTSLLAHSPDGWFLFDLGLSEDTARDPAVWSRWYQWGAPELPGRGDPVLEALATCGVRPDEIAGVVLSHLHVDHTGGLRHFAGGPPIHVQRAELEFGLGEPTPEHASYWRSDYDDPRLRWTPVDGDCELAAGITAIATHGHSPGHMSFRIDLVDAGPVVFAFDAVPLQECVDRDSPIGVVSRAQDDHLRRVAHDRLVALTADSGAPLVPGHCPVVWPQLPVPPAALR